MSCFDLICKLLPVLPVRRRIEIEIVRVERAVAIVLRGMQAGGSARISVVISGRTGTRKRRGGVAPRHATAPTPTPPPSPTAGRADKPD
mmetsp:Transcript_4364/g.9120  ORF Transcript_4364/g.9120 Transcript_4364/m.9120 type:complete len:89 (-) Transcript_4364:676-942(-)